MTSEAQPITLELSETLYALVQISLLVGINAHSHVCCWEARSSQDQTYAALQVLASDDFFLVVHKHDCH